MYNFSQKKLENIYNKIFDAIDNNALKEAKGKTDINERILIQEKHDLIKEKINDKRIKEAKEELSNKIKIGKKLAKEKRNEFLKLNSLSGIEKIKKELALRELFQKDNFSIKVFNSPFNESFFNIAYYQQQAKFNQAKNHYKKIIQLKRLLRKIE